LFVIDAAKESKAKAVAVVDPFSDGALVAAELAEQGYKVVALYSSNLDQLPSESLVPPGVSLSFEAVVPFNEDLAQVALALNSLPDIEVVSVRAGAQTGEEYVQQILASGLLNLAEK
jgi:ABC-type branched-subunit amino acid transport system substrate-binding protein